MANTGVLRDHRNQEPVAPEAQLLSPKPLSKTSDAILGKAYDDHVRLFYNLGKKLGRGQFGVTYLCTENSTGRQFACKSVAKRKL